MDLQRNTSVHRKQLCGKLPQVGDDVTAFWTFAGAAALWLLNGGLQSTCCAKHRRRPGKLLDGPLQLPFVITWKNTCFSPASGSAVDHFEIFLSWILKKKHTDLFGPLFNGPQFIKVSASFGQMWKLTQTLVLDSCCSSLTWMQNNPKTLSRQTKGRKWTKESREELQLQVRECKRRGSLLCVVVTGISVSAPR